MSIKGAVAKKAVKATAKHSAHGTASKLKRGPIRSATLLGTGAAVGVLAGWKAGRHQGANGE